MIKFKINNKEVKVPIIQGGMGIKISLHKLAVAAMDSDCVATLSSAQTSNGNEGIVASNNVSSNLDVLGKEIKQARIQNKDGILGVNIMHALTGYDKYMEYLNDKEIDFIISGAGLPLDMPKYITNENISLAVIVSSAKAFKLITKRWLKRYNRVPDFVVVEGPLAGGHLGFSKEDVLNNNVKDLLELTNDVLKVRDELYLENNNYIHIVPAGGIDNKKEINKYLSIGCSAVQIATKFICTDECDVDINYKNKLVNTCEDDIVSVSSPVGMPGRAVKNNFTEELKERNLDIKNCVNCLSVCKKKDIPYCINERLGDASRGDVDNGLVFTGANAYRIKEIKPFQEVVNELY